MNWTLVTIGKPALVWARGAVEDYRRRIGRAASLEIVSLRENGPQKNGAAMLAMSGKSFRIALDERGRTMRSMDFSRWIGAREMAGTKAVTLFIGGADGHSDELRSAVDDCWSLSAFTIQHELALVMLLEQVYRGYSILRGSPYHRE